jgi:lipopolysaccharide transport system permease protein
MFDQLSETAAIRRPPTTGGSRHPSVPAARTRRRIDSRRERLLAGLAEAWEYRELLYFLVWRELKVRYKQSVVGVGWAILQPVMMMVVFSVVFGHLVKLKTNGPPYPLFVLTGLIAWQLFTYSLSHSGLSLITDKPLITKVYFPRLLIPTAPVLAGLVDFAIASVVLAGFLVYYGVVPPLAILAVPLLVVMLAATALGVGIWIAALNVQYRDFQYTLPFLTQLWFFMTPIAYTATIVPETWRVLLGLNPMAGVVEGLRWALLDPTNGLEPMVFVSAGVCVLVLLSGVVYFRRHEDVFADVA